MSASQPIRLYLLGTPRFEVAGRCIELTAARPIALLAYLSLAASPQPREHLIDLLWSNSTQEAGRKNLRNALWLLRKLFSDDLFANSGDYLALSEQVWSDVGAFEQMSAFSTPGAAMRLYNGAQSDLFSLYRGGLLHGVSPDEAPEFELWLTMERERLAQLFQQSIQRALQGCRQMGDWAGVIALARRGLHDDPLQESLYYAMMEAHALRGERTEALRRYQELRRNLERELDVAPLPETVALRNAIADGELRPIAEAVRASWRPHPQDFAALPVALASHAWIALTNQSSEAAHFAKSMQ